jgi:AcrR family transcriptional regulator
MEKKINLDDRRVLRTRRLLKHALIELTEQKTYEEITIRDITDQADIGYATFFRHYDGKDDLMLEIFTETINEIESLPVDHGDRYFEQEGYLLFEHVAENQSLYRSILDSQNFTRKFREHSKKMVSDHIEEHINHIATPSFPVEIAAQHMVSSLIGLIDWWLTNDLSYPIERMAAIYERLIIQATWQALDADNIMVLPWEESTS